MEPVQTPVPQPDQHDATLDFSKVLGDSSRWIIKRGVPLFKPHERTDPNTGKLIQVDLAKLYRICANMQRMEKSGVPVAIPLGHTSPDKPETHQPPIAGYYVNHRVATFGPNREPAIIADELLDPQYRQFRKNYPYRSSEYYDDSELITKVALLAKDPFLDLGIVAYERNPQQHAATYYHRPPGDPNAVYHFLLGDDPMNDPGTNPQQAQAPTGTPQAPPISLTPNPQPAPHAAPQSPLPYAMPQQQYTPAPNYGQTPARPNPGPAPYSGPWPGPQHRRSNIGHNPPATNQTSLYGWGQRAQRYAEEDDMPPPGGDMGGPPPDMMGDEGGPPPGMGAEGPGAGLEPVLEAAMALVEGLKEYMTSGAGGAGGQQAPQQPFPPDGGGPPVSASRYAHGGNRPQRPQRYAMPGMNVPATSGMSKTPNPLWNREMGDQRAARPTPRGNVSNIPRAGLPTPASRYSKQSEPMRTISGQPVGYQLKLDQQQYQITEQGKVIQMLLYERDLSDTAECNAEIRRLAGLGYDVGEFEAQELKAKPREQRAAYLEHIAAKYQRVPTGDLPPLMGDPTPGVNFRPPPSPDEQRLQMEQALKMSKNDPDPTAYVRALEYLRSGGTPPTQYGNQVIDEGNQPFGGRFNFNAPPPLVPFNGMGAYETNGQAH